MTTSQPQTSRIRKVIEISFDDVGFEAFCFDYFREVSYKFSRGMRKDEKIQLLLMHCDRPPTRFKRLLDCVREEYKMSKFQREELKPLIDALKGPSIIKPPCSREEQPDKQDVEPLKWQAFEAEAKGNLERAEKLWTRVLELSGGNNVTATEALERIKTKRATKRKEPSKPASAKPPKIKPGEPEEPVDETYFTELRNLLKAGKWKEADLETARVLLKIANRQKFGWLRAQDIKAFPSSNFRTIDNLWKRYSNDRFGFTVQRDIWHTVVGQTSQFNEKNFGKNFAKFGDCVGWRVNEEWLITYDEFNFSVNAPEGHLPSLRLPAFEGDTSWYQSWSQLFNNLVKFYFFI